MQSKECNTYHAFEYLLFYSSKYRIEGLYVCYLYLIKKTSKFYALLYVNIKLILKIENFKVVFHLHQMFEINWILP